MSRVLSTEAAKNAINSIQTIVDGGLTTEIQNLNTQGTILSDPNNWDGPLALNFRDGTWPEVQQALNNALQELTDLRQQLSQISTNIFTAGGGS